MICVSRCVETSLDPPIGGWTCYEGDCIYLCGDGLVATGETCDDGANDENGCTANCKGV